MFKHTFFIAATLTVIMIATTSAPSFSQDFGFGAPEQQSSSSVNILNPYDPKYKNTPTVPQAAKPPSPVSSSSFDIGFQNIATGREGDFELFLTTKGSVSGCLEVQKPSVSIKRGGKRLKIELSDSVITADSNKTRYSQHACAVATNGKIASIILNRDELLRDGTTEIEVKKEGAGTLSMVELEISAANILLKPRFPVRQDPFTDSQKQALTLWFYPEQTYVLFNNALDMNNPQHASTVRNLAQNHGLIPLASVNPVFTPLQEQSSNSLYVFNTGHSFDPKSLEQDGVFTLGKVQINQLYHGPNGAYNRPTEKSIFMRRAGAQN